MEGLKKPFDYDFKKYFLSASFRMKLNCKVLNQYYALYIFVFLHNSMRIVAINISIYVFAIISRLL